MCGIFGIIPLDSDTPSIDTQRAFKAAEFLGRRGPDAFKLESTPDYVLAHARLSIIDADARSHQPMKDKTGRYILIYNGEIYNYKEIRQELIDVEIDFKTESDTEVLLQALIFWGEAALKRLHGIFAFAFLDTVTKILILVRDPVGVKPLYFYSDDRVLVFSSLLYPIIYFNQLSEKPKLETVCAFLGFRTTLGDETLVPGIKKLLPGQLLKRNKTGITIRHYWDLLADYEPDSAAFDPRVLERAVSRQLVSAQPFATLLSGGVDSSILSYEISRLSDAPQDCYTAEIEGTAYDETVYARMTSDHINARLHTIKINSDPDVEMLHEIIRLRQNPLGMHNEVGMYQLAKQISLKHKVMFCGEGADELFAGYSRIFRFGFDYQRKKALARLPASLSWLSARLSRALQLDDIHVGQPLKSILGRYSYFPLALQERLLHPALKSSLQASTEQVENYFESLCQRVPEYNISQSDFFSQNSFKAITTIFIGFHLPALLEMVDGTSMACGVEARVPFTDIDMINMALSMPANQKLHWKSKYHFIYAIFKPLSHFSEKADTAKWALKHAYRKKLPRQILQRRKMGFPMPLGLWAVSPKLNDIRQRIFQSNAHINRWFDGESIRHWYNEQMENPDDRFGRQFWLLINLELFFQQSANLSGGEH